MSSHCPRCGATLPMLDASPAPFCASCGLPQLRVSADVVVTRGGADTAAPSTSPPATPGDLKWRLALPVAAVAAASAIVPSLVFPAALALGGAGSLCLVLVPLAAMGAVSFYRRRDPGLGVRGGGRIGAVTGLLLAVFATVATGIAGFVLRYGRHSRELEHLLIENFEHGFAQVRSGATLPPETIALLHAPEVRAGGYIFGQIVIGLLILVLGTLFGALGGALRRPRPPKPE